MMCLQIESYHLLRAAYEAVGEFVRTSFSSASPADRTDKRAVEEPEAPHRRINCMKIEASGKADFSSVYAMLMEFLRTTVGLFVIAVTLGCAARHSRAEI
jgi:hypothetical protein